MNPVSRFPTMGRVSKESEIHMDVTFLEMSIRDFNEVMALWQSTEGIGLSGADSRKRMEMHEKVSYFCLP